MSYHNNNKRVVVEHSRGQSGCAARLDFGTAGRCRFAFSLYAPVRCYRGWFDMRSSPSQSLTLLGQCDILPRGSEAADRSSADISSWYEKFKMVCRALRRSITVIARLLQSYLNVRKPLKHRSIGITSHHRTNPRSHLPKSRMLLPRGRRSDLGALSA